MLKVMSRKFSLQTLVVLAAIILCCFFAILFFSNILVPTKTRVDYTVSQKNNINYYVSLFDNSFMDEKLLGMNQSYISSMIQSINITFSHDSSIDTNQSFDYDYTIYARLSASYKESNGVETEIWDKMYPLKWQEQVKANQGKISINEQISIPYQDYKNIINDFKQSLGINVDAKLDVIMKMHQVYRDTDSKTSKSILSVPMDQDVVQITTEYDKNDSFVKQENVSNLRMNSTVTVILLILLGVGFGFLIFAIVLKLLPSHSKSKYEMMKNKIKKEYSSIIIDVDNHIDFSNFTIFDIKTIEELVDLEEEVRMPILFYEKKKNGVCYFVVIKDNYMYRFTLEDLEDEIL